MTFAPLEIRTRLATLRRTAPDLLEVMYHPGITFETAAVVEVQQKRREMMGDQEYAILTIIPVDVDYTTEVLATDVTHRGRDHIRAAAVVAKAEMIGLLTRLYLSYFPQRHKMLVTANEEEARTWLAKRMQPQEAEV